MQGSLGNHFVDWLLDCVLSGGPDLQPLLASWALEILGSDHAYPQKFSQCEHLAPLQSGIQEESCMLPGPSHLGVHWLGNFPPILCKQQCASASCHLGPVLSLLRGAPWRGNAQGSHSTAEICCSWSLHQRFCILQALPQVFRLSQASPLHHATPSRSSLTN